MHLQHRNRQFLRKWPPTAMWLDTYLAFRRLDTTKQFNAPLLILFSEFWGVCFCKLRLHNTHILKVQCIKYLFYCLLSLQICEEYKNPQTVSDRVLITHPNLYISGSVTVWVFILYRYYYEFYIAANPSSWGVFCISA